MSTKTRKEKLEAIAIAALQGLLAYYGEKVRPDYLARTAVGYAESLAQELEEQEEAARQRDRLGEEIDTISSAELPPSLRIDP